METNKDIQIGLQSATCKYLTYKEWKRENNQKNIKFHSTCKYLTYKEWKQYPDDVKSCNHPTIRHVSTLPIRNGNKHCIDCSILHPLRKYLTYKEWKLFQFPLLRHLLRPSVSTLPIRNGNLSNLQLLHH